MRAAVTLALASVCSVAAAASPWIELIGPDLSTWTQRNGRAEYAIRDGALVGRTVLQTPNSFLCTPRDYGDFVLEYEVKVNPDLNSGVQIRSQAFEGETSFAGPDGKASKIPAGRVHGYQMEIDNEPKKDRWWTAGLYEEGRRGWLYPGLAGGDAKAFTEQGRRISKADDWNAIRVTAVGPRLRSWLNGEPRADARDADWPAGFIGLQVHGVGNDPAKKDLEVAWRNLRILPLGGGAAEPNTLSAVEQLEGWKLLWDGKSGAGWRALKGDAFPAAGWEIQDGTLTMTGGAGDLVTDAAYSDFILKLDVRLTAGANGGIKYFVDPAEGRKNGRGLGLEFQILDDQKHPDAKAGKDGNHTLGSLYDLIPAAGKRPAPIGEWNQILIIAHGTHVEHWLNGDKVVEFERGSPAFRAAVAQSKFKEKPGFGERAEGPILLQDHGDRVSYRNLKIKVLAP